ncbi:MAG: hypothetical protein ACRC14_12235, partial [Paracoccaceae bacterium]
MNVPDAPTKAEHHTHMINDATGAKALLDEHPARSWGYYLPLSNELSTLGPKAKLPDGYRLSQRRSEYRLNFI